MRPRVPAALLLSVIGPIACGKSTNREQFSTTETADTTEAVTVSAGARYIFRPLRDAIPREADTLTPEKIALGRMLYFDKRFSKNHDISCNSCHILAHYGVDNRAKSKGHKGQLGARNSPSVYNAAGHLAQFWDGRSADVETQALVPILNPVEMAMFDETSVLSVLQSIPAYVDAFTRAFPDDTTSLSFVNFGNAVGAFERQLVTKAPWDRFLEGDVQALTDEQKTGVNTFISVGCGSCHEGEVVGGTMYEKLGRSVPWPNLEDRGRVSITKHPRDDAVFKVPSLRNVEKTAPYFHDGSTDSLPEAVRLMAKHQLSTTLSETQVANIVSWLTALTGQLPMHYIEEPNLPASTARTPTPNPN
jgi:cytochrome c peroxidase